MQKKRSSSLFLQVELFFAHANQRDIRQRKEQILVGELYLYNKYSRKTGIIYLKTEN